MKSILKKTIYLVSILIFGSCSQYNLDPQTEIKKGEKIESTITIEDLSSTYMTSLGSFTADRISSDNPVVINGIVTSTDIEGNVYKYISVQEEFTNGRAIRISIDASGISAIYPIGQRVSVVLNDLCIGKYGESPQIGTYYLKGTRLSPGAIPMPIAREKVIAYGNAEPQAVVADTMTIAEILAAPKDEMHYRLICIKDANFNGYGEVEFTYKKLTASELYFGNPIPTITGVPIARELVDATGKIYVATSEYAKFAQNPLPASTYKGDITVLVSWYNSDPKYTGNYQLTLRTLGDLGSGFDGYLSTVNYTR
ncbi:MAG: DUF5689 domain-containing protein [Paludibacter sp.]|nr:DUF5689 domain-containing protein [Paludibacter sp.]